MQFLELDQLPSFMPKYGNFENGPVSWKPLLVEQKISSISTPLVRKWVYVQLLESLPKYENFENRSVSRKPLPIERV